MDDYTFLPSPESKTQGKTNDASPGAASTVPPSAAATVSPSIPTSASHSPVQETPPLRTLPDVADSARPAPTAGEVRISQTAIYHRMRRVMYPKGGKGQKRVSDEVVKQWEKGGKSRKTLEQVFQSCGYNADMGLKHVLFGNPGIKQTMENRKGYVSLGVLASTKKQCALSACVLLPLRMNLLWKWR